jgi:hypothetical protein
MNNKLNIYRIYVFLLVIWSFLLGAFVSLFPRQIIGWINVGEMDVTFFVGCFGVFILILAYIQWILFNNIDDRKILRIVAAFRFILPVYYIIAAIFLLPRPFALFNYILLFLAGGDLFMNLLLIYLAKRFARESDGSN